MTEIDAASIDDTDEILRRLPEITAIRGQLSRDVADAFIDGCPNYFWIVRASESHHPTDERGAGGLWLHTKRSFTSWSIIERSLREMSLISSFEANCGRAAILLHDMFKYGRPENKFDEDEEMGHDYILEGKMDYIPSYATNDHGVICAEWVRCNTEMPEAVARCIETHNGGWYEGPSPDDPLELGHHLADYYASQSYVRYPVLDPPKELEYLVDEDVPAIENEDFVEELIDRV